jgi:hypothetical protein
VLERGAYKRSLVTDSYDVMFQRNPFDVATSPHSLALVANGVRHRDVAWNLDQQLGLQTSINMASPPGGWTVLDSGVQCGSAIAMKQLCLLMYTNLLTADPDSTDQAMLNFLYHTLLRGSRSYEVHYPMDSTLCATAAIGASQAHRNVLTWDGSAIRGQRGVFAIVHQWNRTRFRGAIATRYVRSDLPLQQLGTPGDKHAEGHGASIAEQG